MSAEQPQSLAVEVRVLAERVRNLLDRIDEDRGAHKALEQRVSDLERARAYYAGAAAFGGAVLGWAGNLLLHLVTK
jgi:hypothetical protein